MRAELELKAYSMEGPSIPESSMQFACFWRDARGRRSGHNLKVESSSNPFSKSLDDLTNQSTWWRHNLEENVLLTFSPFLCRAKRIFSRSILMTSRTKSPCNSRPSRQTRTPHFLSFSLSPSSHFPSLLILSRFLSSHPPPSLPLSIRLKTQNSTNFPDDAEVSF